MNSGVGVLLILMVIMNLLDGGFSNPKEYFTRMLVMLPGMVIGFSFHEFGHAISSYRLGDPTPKIDGRVSLNPVAHVDPMGLIALIFCGFGWGKPVMIDPRYYKNPRRDEMIVSFAGVFNNLILAIFLTFILKQMLRAMPYASISLDSPGNIAVSIVFYAIFINLVLMVFNLMPIPPLDGFGILTQIFDLRRYSWYDKFYGSGMLILLILLVTNLIDKILTPAVNGMFNLLINVIVR